MWYSQCSVVVYLQPFVYFIIFTDRVPSTRGKVIVSLCLSVHTCGGGWGVPQPGPGGGRGVPHLGYPPSNLAQGSTLMGGGYHTSGTPHQTWPLGYPTSGTPPVRPGGGVPQQGKGYPTSGTPLPIRPGQGGLSHRVVLDTPRSVCLLRSRKRTFLY